MLSFKALPATKSGRATITWPGAPLLFPRNGSAGPRRFPGLVDPRRRFQSRRAGSALEAGEADIIACVRRFVADPGSQAANQGAGQNKTAAVAAVVA